MDLLNETVLLKTKSTLFSLLIRETLHFLCYERLLNMTYVAYKKCIFREMQFWLHCYTVVSYHALFRLSVCKIPAVYIFRVQKMCVFATIRYFGSPTYIYRYRIKETHSKICYYTFKDNLKAELIVIPTLFFKKAKGILLSPPSVRPSVRPSVMLSPPKPLDEIQSNLMCE